jgi:D-3-phosphoglycerate dehydrogenase
MSTFNVLLLDGIDPAGVKLLERTGAIVPVVHDKISREKLLELVPEADGIIVRSGTMIDKELIQKATRLRVVGRAGVGVDNVDIDAATERGILVMNSPAVRPPPRRSMPSPCSSPWREVFRRHISR